MAVLFQISDDDPVSLAFDPAALNDTVLDSEPPVAVLVDVSESVSVDPSAERDVRLRLAASGFQEDSLQLSPEKSASCE